MEKLNFGFSSRKTVLKNSEKHPLDLVILGGGITGAGCLREAASRGLNALLLEQNDFASGTSGYSSKLIHGGLRYLETGDIKLVFESVQERSILLRTAPTLVKSLAFLYPVYKTHRRGLPLVVAGTHLYHLLTLFRGMLPGPSLRFANRTLAMEPGLNPQGLIGSVKYYDAITSDVDLTLATAQDCWKRGAYACNHVSVTDLVEENGTVVGVKALDTIANKAYTIRSKWVINATGPWSDLTRENFLHNHLGKLRLTKGVHLILKEHLQLHGHAILMISPIDERVTFAIPWMGHTMVGTTDTDYAGNPADAKATQADIDYLLETYRFYFPQSNATSKDILSTFAGVRPLIKQDNKAPSSVSREHLVFSDRAGFVSIVGGKLTSYRKMAKDVLDWVAEHTPPWQKTLPPSQTHNMPLTKDDCDVRDFQYMAQNQMACTPDDILMRRNKTHYLHPEDEPNQRKALEKFFRSLTNATDMID